MTVSRDNPRILIGASIPRSGHHFLADMMTAYYGNNLYYCEYYTLPSCCRAVPCTRRGAHNIIYQKSHDRDFKLAADVAHALYLIQYRHPVPEALSDRELDLQDSFGRPSLAYRSTHAGYMNWLAGKAIYYRRFHDKWIAPKLANAIYLDYAPLAADPKKFLKTISRVLHHQMNIEWQLCLHAVDYGCAETEIRYKVTIHYIHLNPIR